MNLNGIIVPLVTPFDQNNKIDVAALAQLVESFIERGVHGIVACGTTGEYYTFSEEERLTVLQTVAKVAKNRVSLIAGANDLSTAGAIRRAQQAEDLGYEGLMLSAPAYCLPDQDGIIQHFEQVADACALPIVMYNFPARIGVSIEFDTVAHLAQHPSIKGIKESSGNFSHALSLLQANFADFEVVCGCDDQALDFFFWGARSWISGAANVFPTEQVALFQAAQQQDWAQARTIMQSMYPAIQSMESGNYNQKAKVGCLGGQFNAGGVRLPLMNLPDADQQAFLALLPNRA